MKKVICKFPNLKKLKKEFQAIPNDAKFRENEFQWRVPSLAST